MWLVPWQRMNGEGVHFNKIYGFLGVFSLGYPGFSGFEFFFVFETLGTFNGIFSIHKRAENHSFGV